MAEPSKTSTAAAPLTERVRDALRISEEFVPVFTEACRIFGINPDPELQPRELWSHRCGGDPAEFEPPYVVLVTGGGLKLRYPIDVATEERLRAVFKAFRWTGQHHDVYEALPLPRDLRLPTHHKTGIPPAQMGV